MARSTIIERCAQHWEPEDTHFVRIPTQDAPSSVKGDFHNLIPIMSSNSLILLARIAGPLAASVLAYLFWRYISTQHGYQRRKDALLIVTYIASRLGLWLIFTIYMQDYVTTSDARLFYIPQLEHFL